MCRVSDHAVLRYIERVLKVDVQAVRRELEGSHKAIDAAAAFGCGTVKLGDGTRLKLQGDTVTTVVEARKNRKKQKGRR